MGTTQTTKHKAAVKSTKRTHTAKPRKRPARK
jgi:hypothetical protein